MPIALASLHNANVECRTSSLFTYYLLVGFFEAFLLDVNVTFIGFGLACLG